MIHDTLIGLALLVSLFFGSMTPQAAPQAEGGVGTALIQGSATWYDAPSSTDAAAGPGLRVGNWRGSWVRVQRPGYVGDCTDDRDPCVVVRLSDWCACGERGGQPTLLDLDDRAFARLAPLSRGVIEVEVEWGGPVLPQTDTE